MPPVVFSALHLSGKQRRLLLIVEQEAYARAANQAKPLHGGLTVQMWDAYEWVSVKQALFQHVKHQAARQSDGINTADSARVARGEVVKVLLRPRRPQVEGCSEPPHDSH